MLPNRIFSQRKETIRQGRNILYRKKERIRYKTREKKGFLIKESKGYNKEDKFCIEKKRRRYKTGKTGFLIKERKRDKYGIEGKKGYAILNRRKDRRPKKKERIQQGKR